VRARDEFFWTSYWANGYPLRTDEDVERARDDAKRLLDTLDHERNVGLDDHHRRQMDELRRQLRNATENNALRNKQLDALHMVWCDGGCNGGMHRYTDKLTPDEVLDAVAVAEANIVRMKRWAAAAAYRAARGTSI
jgi:hypothetical protein